MTGPYPSVGAVFAGYRIEEPIGRGGMSVVYRAEQIRLGRKVALKFLSAELAEDEGFRQRFIRESQLAASLEHPNIIPIYEADEVEGRLFIAMRFVQGEDLKSLIEREGRLEPERVCAILAQTSNALDAAHARGLVHRDVKPGNILIASGVGPESPDHVYLSDFGLTRRTDSTSRFTRTGQFVGTLDYVAPEQIEGGVLDGRTDIYALACVAYEALTGSVPFDRESEIAVMYAHLQDPPPSPSHKLAGTPPDVDRVIAVGMAKQRTERHSTCRAFVSSLTAALRAPVAGYETKEAPAEFAAETVTGARRPPEQTTTVAAAPTMPVAPRVTVASREATQRVVGDDGGAPTHPRRRPAVLTLILLAAFVVLVAAGGFLLLTRNGGDTGGDDGSSVEPFRGPTVAVTPASIQASSTAPEGEDNLGNTITYEAETAIDSDPSTAWRTPGDGVGETLVVGFSEEVRLVRIGLIPGYDKIDPHPTQPTDRFVQNRRVREVEYTFADGSTATQTFEDDRRLQFIDIDVVTDEVTIAILATRPPSPPPGVEGREYTPISHIEFHAADGEEQADNADDSSTAASSTSRRKDRQSSPTYAFPVQPSTVADFAQGHHDYPATDIFAPVGSDFVAATSGVVDAVSRTDQWDPAVDNPATRGGLYVSLVGDDGVRYYGSHLSKVAPEVTRGMRVETGALLGLTGNSGNAEGTTPHLHFGISHPTFPNDWRVRRGEIDPYPFLLAWIEGRDLSPRL